VTADNGYYEPGVYDLRAARPRATALTQMITQLASKGTFEHPVLGEPGWWHRDSRFAPGTPHQARGRPILVTGGAGTLAQAFVRACEARALAHRSVGRAELDIADPVAVASAMSELDPWAVINCAGYVKVDQAESEVAACYRDNALGAGVLAETCAARGLPLLTFSSDLVFAGDKREPYVESDRVGPVNVYGASKVEGERLVLARHPRALIVRTSAFFGPWDGANFLTRTLELLARGEPVPAAADVMISPTYVPDLVRVCLDFLLDGEHGVWHFANAGAVTWANLASQVAEVSGAPPHLVEALPSSSMGFTAVRPRFSVLGSERGRYMPDLHGALERWLAAVAA
jgi:dTDP-4-dehydrorhamnose reductase